MNSITELLDLEDSEIIISNISIQGSRKFLTLETLPAVHFCPSCGFKMYSRGIKTRTINHPILQDHYELILLLKQPRWRCTNPDCSYETNESFKFVNKSRRSTNATDMLIISAYRDLAASSVSIANRFHVSDSHVMDVFDRYVKLDRLPLSDITEPYFASIPVSERNTVKYLISDMYNPYLTFVSKYFPSAVPVVDSFHVIQWIVCSISFSRNTAGSFCPARQTSNIISNRVWILIFAVS